MSNEDNGVHFRELLWVSNALKHLWCFGPSLSHKHWRLFCHYSCWQNSFSIPFFFFFLSWKHFDERWRTLDFLPWTCMTADATRDTLKVHLFFSDSSWHWQRLCWACTLADFSLCPILLLPPPPYILCMQTSSQHLETPPYKNGLPKEVSNTS